MKYRNLILLVCLLFLTSVIVNYAYGGEKILYSKVQTIEPEEVNGQYCFVNVIIKQQGDNIIKEEVMECADGKKGIDTPGYWELFAQFYY